MRFVDFKPLLESMSFHAYKKDPKRGYWMMVTGDEPMFQDEVYKTDFDRSGKDPYDYKNPKYDPEHDLNLSNSNAYEVFDVIGYDAEDTVPINEFIARTTQWLQKHIGKLSAKQEPEVDQTPGGATFVQGGKREGYFNDIIKQMNKIARDGKAMGATHVGIN